MIEPCGNPVPGYVRASDGIKVAWEQRGHAGGPVVVAVHGYPDNRTLWRGVMDRLTDRYQVVTYDVRGAGDSDAPATREAYRLDQLADDLRTVLAEVAPERPVHLLAHDWGSIQCWHALTDPAWSGRVASFTSISGPCLDRVGEWVRERLRHPRPRRLAELVTQLALSGYIGFFRVPRLPEWAWERGACQRLLESFERRDPATEQHPTRPDLADALRGLNLYRANMLPRARRSATQAVTIPVQVLAPTGDPFVSAALQTDLGAWATDLRTHRVAGGHWTPRTRPGIVAERVAEFVDEVEAR